MLESLLSDLRNNRPVSPSPLLYEHELLSALYALKNKIKLQYHQLENGAVPLFKRGYFSWGALPYPREHAEFGICLAKLGKKEPAKKLAEWQFKTLDHNQNPIFSIFSQEGGDLEALKLVNQELFSFFPQLESPLGFFYDPHFSFCGYKGLDTTILSFGLGCKSGVGVFLHQDVGIVNMGPHNGPLNSCESFGLAGVPKKLTYSEKEHESEFFCLTALSAPHPRNNLLQDSGFSGIWFQGHHRITPNSLSLQAGFESLLPLDQILFSFLGKGEKCLINKKQILRPQSLDHYEGPPASIEFRGKRGGVVLEIQGCDQMKAIPLSKGNRFWGADFLISFSLKKTFTCNFLTCKN